MTTSRRRCHGSKWLPVIAIGIAILALTALTGSARAATWKVGTQSDIGVGACPSSASTNCSLRQIINAINATPFPPDTILVPAGTYTLSQGALVITQSMALTGAGARSTVIAQPPVSNRSTQGDRVFNITGAAATVAINAVEVTGGDATSVNGFFGGDIQNAGALTLADDWITNGSGWSGGGVANRAGSLTVERTLVSGNHAPYGGGDSGGIQNWGCTTASGCSTDQPGHLVIDDSTIAGNDARLVGGVFSWNDDNNTLTVTSSTIAGNVTKDEPGGAARGGGGGLGVGQGSERVQDTIIANNLYQTGGTTTAVNCGPITSGGITSLGHNLDSGVTCALPPTDLSNANPQLGPLQNNGGPTDTMALPASSPAIDQVPTSGANCPATDQRGIPRPQGRACDIGAYELAVPVHCTNVSAQTPAGGGVVSVPLSCTGPAQRTYSILSGPAHGTLDAINQTNGSVNYTPSAGFSGTDTFTYAATDAGGPSNQATATITVPPAPPHCGSVTVTVPPGTRHLAVRLLCAAPAGVSFTYGVVQGPSRGAVGEVNQLPGTVVYTPRPNSTGVDRFSYNATDWGGTSAPATVTVVFLPFHRLNPTVTWAFSLSGGYTLVRSLVAWNVPRNAAVRLSCTRGCGFASRTKGPPKPRRVCQRKSKRTRCRTIPPPRLRTVDITRLVRGRRIPAGAHLTVSIVAPNTIGKVYIIAIRKGRQPSVTVTCLAPGQKKPGRGC